MKVDEILDELELSGSYNTNRLIYANTLFYYGSILLNSYNVRLDGKNVNYFGMTLANSGAGKDWANHQVLRIIFQGREDEYASAMRHSAKSMFPDGYHFNNGLQTGMTLSLEGTKEGLFVVAQAQANSGFGSLNLIANEMGRIISSSNDLIEKTKELYDGTYKAKVVKGSKDDERECDIRNIVCNMLMFGSQAGMSGESKDELIELCGSGLYRRSIIVNVEPHLRALKEDLEPTGCIEWFEGYRPSEIDMRLDEEAKLFVKEIKEELISIGNENLYNDFIQSESSSHKMIINTACIMAFLEKESVVNIRHIQDAYDFFKATRATISDALMPYTLHDSIHKLLKRSKVLTRHEAVELDGSLNVSKTKWDDAIDIVSEMCYTKNEYLNITGTKVTRYGIEELPINKLDKIKIGVTDDEGAYAINFKSLEVPFFGEGMSLEGLLRSNKPSFTTCHFENSSKVGDGHRRAESFISGQNLIAFDIDYGMTVDEALEILKPYTYILYTTKKHRKLVDGVQYEDRFRVLMPTLTDYYVDVEQHKAMYENLSKILGFVSYDVATRNVSRLWFINNECELYKGEGTLLDVTVALPSTDKEELIMPIINEVLDDSKIERRLNGMFRWFLTNTYKNTNRNNNLFRLGSYVKDLGMNVEYNVRLANSKLLEPLEERELTVLINSCS